MSFFKDFKDDFSEAIDELVPGTTDATAVPKQKEGAPIETDVDADTELSKLDGLLEEVAKSVEKEEQSAAKNTSPVTAGNSEEKAATVPMKKDAPAPEKKESAPAKKITETVERKMNIMDTNDTTVQTSEPEVEMPSFDTAPASDENAVITKNMKITGDLESTGSIEVQGLINGNVKCNGKLTVTGTINGNSTSAEFFADAARIQGEISSTGTVKVGVNSVVIGNISATSAVIAGAVKGDIDIQGPVVVDSSAVVAGDIVSRSAQINNGAVIEGFCSQKYADMDVNSIFEK